MGIGVGVGGALLLGFGAVLLYMRHQKKRKQMDVPGHMLVADKQTYNSRDPRGQDRSRLSNYSGQPPVYQRQELYANHQPQELST